MTQAHWGFLPFLALGWEDGLFKHSVAVFSAWQSFLVSCITSKSWEAEQGSGQARSQGALHGSSNANPSRFAPGRIKHQVMDRRMQRWPKATFIHPPLSPSMMDILEAQHRVRIIESLRLEKTSKIIKFNRQPNTTMPAKPCPEVPCLHIFWTPSGMVTPPLPWAACSNAWPLFQ